MSTNASPQLLLQQVLVSNPRATLDEIRRFHPAFRAMSLDQLSLRLGRLLDRSADSSAK